MPDDLSFTIAVAALFLGVLALLAGTTWALNHGGPRAPWVALGLLFVAIGIVVLVSGS